MMSTDELLEQAIHDGSIDIPEWPRVLEHILHKLHTIVHDEFPVPVVPPPEPGVASSITDETSTTKSLAPPTDPLSQPPSSTDKENTAPRPPVPPFSAPSRSLQAPREPAHLPPDLRDLYHHSLDTLRSSFSTSPPYTIQRLAELVLQPKRYYRHLPPYLAALDRVVSVTSPTTNFPLSQPHINASDFLANGDPAESLSERENLGSDESLGGALLTPIPWLKRENGHSSQQELRSETSQTIEGPNGTGVIETVTVAMNRLPSNSPPEDVLTHDQVLRSEGAVTQGELLRQEQEAGIVPVGHEVPRRAIMSSNATTQVGRDTAALEDGDATEKPEEHPHARGPDVIGAEDMGPQDTAIGVSRPLNMEAAAGRAKSPEKEEKDAEGDSTIEDISEQGTSETEEKQAEEPAKEEQSDEVMNDAT